MPAKCAAPRATAHLSQEYRTPAWEQRKLGELTESYSGGTPAAGESEFYGGSIPFIRSAEIAAESTELFLTEKGYESSSARMVKPGDVLYALYGATSGEVAVSRQKGAINQAILAILPRDDCDARYITAWLRKQKGYIVTTYLQGGQGNLSGVIVKNLEVFIPSLPEQQKIGFMLSHLDSLITLHQRKYDGCANPLFSERRISCRKPSHQNRCSATTTPSG
ncbi:restriction endonuclease subunit S [Bifidobacterium adolescentis]|uniref:restriction endonuclease subunit S n=1 Tax=Bifidobacterium adolescentis TaxID=1680 RepID=UPI0009B97E92|nr:restriction endonuclease subunit S [Bifidobacterium adolescentis]